MKALLITLTGMMLFGCMTRSAMMTHEHFNDIPIGMSIAKVEAISGKPYAIHTKGPGQAEYEYIEKIDLGSGLIYENHYYLMIVDEVVTKKRYEYETLPSYDFLYSDDPNVFNNY